MRIKICGITRADQGVAIAAGGASVLGFICVPQSPRYVTPATVGNIVQGLPQPWVDRFGVFADASLATIAEFVAQGRLSGVQLHGQETPQFCQQLRLAQPQVEIIKALRIRTAADLEQVEAYTPYVDTFLLDAYHPQQLGGTGKTLDWHSLQSFQPGRPWFLAGGLRPDNVAEALTQLSPDGIDVSSGVENAPGDKNLQQVARLIAAARQISPGKM